MADYQVAVMNEADRPLAAVTVEAVSLNSWPTVSATGDTNRAGVVQFSSLTGPHWFRPRVTRVSTTVGERVYTGAVKVQVIALGESLNADYVVDSNGMGTHLLLFGTTGALEAAIADEDHRTIWVCSSHTETLTSTHNLGKISKDNGTTYPQVIKVLSGQGDRPAITFDFDGSAITDANVHGVSEVFGLIFENISFVAASGRNVTFYDPNGTDETALRELKGVVFTGSGTWDQIVDMSGASTGTLFDLVIDDCRGGGNYGTLTQLFKSGSASTSDCNLVIRNCEFSLAHIMVRSASTDVDTGGNDTGTRAVQMLNNRFTLSDYAWQWTFRRRLIIIGNTFNYSSANNCFELGTSGSSAGMEDISIVGNAFRGSSTGSFIDIDPNTGAGENIVIVGNNIIGSGSGTAIVVVPTLTDSVVINGYRDWTTNVGGAGATSLNTLILGDLEIDGDLNHDGSNIGFFGTAPVAQSAAYSVTDDNADRAYSADATTLHEVADVLATVISDLQAYGLLG